MVILFTSVNSDYIERHSFDHLDLTDRDDCLLVIREAMRDADENGLDYHLYDMTTDRPRHCLNRDEFMTDYNDEVLDGGWWCFLLEGITDKDIVETFYK